MRAPGYRWSRHRNAMQPPAGSAWNAHLAFRLNRSDGESTSGRAEHQRGDVGALFGRIGVQVMGNHVRNPVRDWPSARRGRGRLEQEDAFLARGELGAVEP